MTSESPGNIMRKAQHLSCSCSGLLNPVILMFKIKIQARFSKEAVKHPSMGRFEIEDTIYLIGLLFGFQKSFSSSCCLHLAPLVISSGLFVNMSTGGDPIMLNEAPISLR